MHSRRSFYLCIFILLLRFPVHPYHFATVRAFQLYYDPEPRYADIKNPSPALMVRAFDFLDDDHLLS